MLWKKQSRVRWGSGGQSETSYIPSLYTQCSSLLSSHKHFFSPSYTTNQSLSHSSLTPFAASLLQQVVYTLCFPFLTSLQLSPFHGPCYSQRLQMTSMLPNPVEMNPKFHTVDHSLFLETCHHHPLGFHCTALSFFSSYFPNLHWQLQYFWPSFKCLCSSWNDSSSLAKPALLLIVPSQWIAPLSFRLAHHLETWNSYSPWNPLIYPSMYMNHQVLLMIHAKQLRSIYF